MAISAVIANVAVAASSIASAGLSAYQAVDSSNKAETAKNVAAEEKFKQDQLIQEQKQKEKDQAIIEKQTLARDAGRLSQQQKALSASGRAGTILTGALGIPNSGASAASGGKTLLGY
jgi:hypothetical protein